MPAASIISLVSALTSIVRRRVTWALAALLTGVVCGLVWGIPVIAARTSPPDTFRETAEASLRRARDAGAPAWADADLAEAVRACREASFEDRRQQLRPFVVRDYADARERYRGCAAAALEATAAAELARRSASDAARIDIDDVSATLAQADALVGRLRLGRSEVAALQGARLRLAEAEALWDQQSFELARVRAKRAQDELGRALQGVGRLTRRFADDGQLARWRRQIRETINWSARHRAPAIVVYKDRNQLVLYERGRAVVTYPVDLGANNLSEKVRAGDAATPEGRYRIVEKKGRGESRYHKALLLDYPNDDDRKRFAELRRAGRVPAGASPGGLIEIHGEGGRGADWTRGCVALANRHMDEVFGRVGHGTPVTIVGGDGDGGLAELARRFALGASR